VAYDYLQNISDPTDIINRSGNTGDMPAPAGYMPMANYPGTAVEYIIIVTNTGAGESAQTVVYDILPAELTNPVNTCAYNMTYDDVTRTLTWTVGSIAAGGGTAAVTFTADIASGETLAENTAYAYDEATNPNGDNPSVSPPVDINIKSIPGKLTVNKTADPAGDAIDPAKEFAFQIKQGPSESLTLLDLTGIITITDKSGADVTTERTAPADLINGNFNLCVGDAAVIDGLPYNRYTVYEMYENNYSLTSVTGGSAYLPGLYSVVTLSSSNVSDSLTFTNKYTMPSGPKLPETGGISKKLIETAGTVAMLGAAGAIYYRRKKAAILRKHSSQEI